MLIASHQAKDFPQQAQQAQKLLADAAEVKEKLVAGATKTIESMDDNDVRKMVVKQAQKQKQKVSKLFGEAETLKDGLEGSPEHMYSIALTLDVTGAEVGRAASLIRSLSSVGHPPTPGRTGLKWQEAEKAAGH